LGPVLIEPLFRARLKASDSFGGPSMYGISSYDLQGNVRVDDEVSVGPFLRFTTKSLNEGTNSISDRDLVTVGTFYQGNFERSYFDATAAYSQGSTAKDYRRSRTYKPIFSVTARTGFKWGNFNFGGLGEIHDSQGTETEVGYFYYNEEGADSKLDPFRILLAGPELGFSTNRLQIKAHYKVIINNSAASLDDLGDKMDRGAGHAGFGTSLSMLF
jgi:hypothetical protein